MAMDVKMVAQEGMKECLEMMLKERAEQDELFAASFYNSNKSMDECFRYIMSEVAKANEKAIRDALKNRNSSVLGIGFDSDWVMNKAIHYFDEADLEVPKSLDMSAYMPKQAPLPPRPVTPRQGNTTNGTAATPYQAPIIPIQSKAVPKFGEDTLFFGLDDEEEPSPEPVTPNDNDVPDQAPM